jgi:hypothetical protein
MNMDHPRLKTTWHTIRLAADPAEQNNVAATNAKIRDKLSNRLNMLLREMRAEMPMINPAFDPNSKSRRKNLGTTKDLAEKERGIFEWRLKQ